MYYEHTCYDGEAECTFTFEAETGTLTGAYVWSRDLDGEPGGFDPAGFEAGENRAFAHARPETLPQLVQRFRRWHGELGDDCPPAVVEWFTRKGDPCPECGGSGGQTSELGARYNDSSEPCERCQATGRIAK